MYLFYLALLRNQKSDLQYVLNQRYAFILTQLYEHHLIIPTEAVERLYSPHAYIHK